MRWAGQIVFWMAVTCLPLAHADTGAMPETNAMELRSNRSPQPCRSPFGSLPDDFVVVAAGAYSGRKTQMQIDSSGHQATRMDVIVNYPNQSVVLMLGAYEPTIWDLSWTATSSIAGVMLSGHYRQVVTGLSPEVPTLVTTRENGGGCGVFIVEQKRLSALNPVSRAIFGREVSMVYLADHGQITIGEEVSEQEALQRHPGKRPEDYSLPELSGIPGLDQAVTRGLLRKATLEDAERWVEVLTKSANWKARDVPPVAGHDPVRPQRPILLNAYVVLKPYRFPEGLYGGHSAVFFIPEGVPMPSGNPGHSTIYDFNRSDPSYFSD